MEISGLDTKITINRSEIIEQIAKHQSHLSPSDVDLAIKAILSLMSDTLAQGDRIEIRGMGCFTLRRREPRIARNPKTGQAVAVPESYSVHFKPGKELKERVNNIK